MKKVEFTVAQIQEKAEDQLQNLMNSGNTRETASFVQSVAAVLNEKSAPTATAGESKKAKEKSEEEKKKSMEVTICLLLFGIIQAGDG